MSDTVPIEHPSWLTSGDFTEADEPLRLFAAWMEEATRSEPADPNAMTLATVDADGLPNARMILLKACIGEGSFSTPTLTAKKAGNLAPIPRRRWFFTGSR